jgi:hypothetical protein
MGGRRRPDQAVSAGRRTEGTGLPPEVDVQAHHEELTCTHAAIVRDITDKVNREYREYTIGGWH